MATFATLKSTMEYKSEWTPQLLIPSSLVLIFGVVTIGLTRRLLFSALAKIPGPKLGAATWFWMWYWDLREESALVIQDLHKQHGPIVRIGPNEHPRYYDAFANGTHNIFTVSDQAQHAQLRRLMSNSFARTQILSFEPYIWEKARTLSSILAEQYGNGEVLNLVFAFRCLALDVITTFAYGEAFGALHCRGFREPLLEAFDSFATANTFFMISPKIQALLSPLITLLPTKTFKAFAKMEVAVIDGIRKMKARKEDVLGFIPMLSGEIELGNRSGIEITNSRLISDGIGSIFAGTDTTGIALSVGTWAIFSKEEIRQRLHADLKEIWQDLESHPSLPQLEALPYIRACVFEALRLATPIQTRFPRVVPAEGWSYQGHHLPAGTTISSSSFLMHNEELVFPNPREFDPDRWLTEDAELLTLRKKHWAPFSLGVRQCVGLNIATAEIYIGFAEIFRKFIATEVVTQEFKPPIGVFTVTIPDGLNVKVRRITE